MRTGWVGTLFFRRNGLDITPSTAGRYEMLADGESTDVLGAQVFRHEPLAHAGPLSIKPRPGPQSFPYSA